ncbi:MAG TPA: GIY-YIG nuclease family protein [Candidatus Paceibacterota bacterium]|jgi:predicted GIY-YIG superfamily endonuclease|nr:GIY-YIG nuclease family protein [Candidatus Paceibacterota bacterium]
MHYCYILKSTKDSSYYIGSTQDLKKRLEKHNRKEVTYSSTRAPFKIAWYAAFQTKDLALAFEKYLKSSSGFAFRNKRLI